MIKPSFWIVSALCMHLVGASNDLEKKAKQLFEAKDYAQAILCYEDLMKESKTGFQREILQYNIATAYLANHQYEKATKELASILYQVGRCPKHLIERAYYNQFLAQIGWVDELLTSSQRTEGDLERASQLLDEAQASLKGYTEVKYGENQSELETSEELKELKYSLKELRSKWKKIRSQLILGQLDFPKGVDRVKRQVQDQIEAVEHYFESSLLQNFLKYALTREYQQAKKELPFWGRLKEILGEMRHDVELKLSESSSDEEKEALLKQQKNFEAFFSQAESGHKTALDCFKEHYLKRAWIELNKAKWGLSFMQQIASHEDLLKYCLEQKCSLVKKMSSSKKAPLYEEASYEMVGYLNELALLFSKQLFSSGQTSLHQELLKKLSHRLQSEDKPTCEKLLQDTALYQALYEEPTNWLLPVYAHLEKKKDLKEEDKIAFSPQLFALKERYQTERHLKRSDETKTQADYICKHLDLLEEHLAKKEPLEAHKVLEDTLINLDYAKLVVYHLEEMKKLYDLALKDLCFEESYKKRLEERKNRILAFPLHLEEPDRYQEMYTHVHEQLEPLFAHHEKAQNTSFRHKLRKLFLKNASLAVTRLQKDLEEKKPTSVFVLLKGIQDQKMSLENSEAIDHLFGVSPEEQKSFFSFVLESQNIPIKSVEPFEALFQKEGESSPQEANDLQRRHDTLKWFQAGLKEAKEAKEFLTRESIAWEKVTQKQKAAIEYWEKALSQKNSSSQNNEGSQQNQPSESEQESEASALQESSLDRASIDEKQSSSLSEENMAEDFAKEQESRDLLQRLQEMQKNDELTSPQKRAVKKGLRPW